MALSADSPIGDGTTVERTSLPLMEERAEPRRWRHLIIKHRLGAGAFGTVYRAHDPQLQMDVALKLYRQTPAAGDPLAVMFSEGRLLARVRHPNVVAVHGVDRQGDEVGLWLELIDGRTLADELATNGPFGFREATLVGQDVCRALAAVHHAGLVHRDVKAQNVMRERGGRIVLMDFGIGRALDAREPAPEVRGTPVYMAPELFGGGPATATTDIYSVGVLLFFLVTGSYPVPGSDLASVARSHRDGARRLLRDVRPDLPDSFVEVIEHACAARPPDRFATAGAMQAALAGILGATSERSSPGNLHSAMWGKVAAGLLLAVGIAALAGSNWFRSTESPTSDSSVSRSAANPAGGSAPVDADRYAVRATFHRALPSGDETLAPDARVAPGDRLFVRIRATRPLHVYIVNQDERGESYLLFPLPGQKVSNPLAANTQHQLPGGGDDVYWQVTSTGGREHFLVIASPEPLQPLEAVFAKLPKPQAGRAVDRWAAMPDEAVGQLRGIGGLTSARPTAPAADVLRSAVALPLEEESVKGPWIRRFTLENPGR